MAITKDPSPGPGRRILPWSGNEAGSRGPRRLDPERTAEQKARTLFDFFSPTLIRLRTLSIGRAVE
jgi:hypothetical protein